MLNGIAEGSDEPVSDPTPRPAMTSAQENALESAEDYLDTGHSPKAA
jgi:hypothetical protein